MVFYISAAFPTHAEKLNASVLEYVQEAAANARARGNGEEEKTKARGGEADVQEEEELSEEAVDEEVQSEEGESSDADEVSWIQWFCSLQVCSTYMYAPPTSHGTN